MRITLFAALMLLLTNPAHATFSIVAIDPANGDLGVAGYVSIRVDSDADPFHQLRRILDLQLARNYASSRSYLVRNGKLAEAFQAAGKAVEYEPTVAANHLHLGFLSYLAGQRERASQAFARARQLTLNFKQAWDATLANPDFAAYRKVRDDQAFAAGVAN